MVRDKDTEGGIAGAVIKVDDIDHHIRSGGVGPVYQHVASANTSVDRREYEMGRDSLASSASALSQLLAATTGDC